MQSKQQQITDAELKDTRVKIDLMLGMVFLFVLFSSLNADSSDSILWICLSWQTFVVLSLDVLQNCLRNSPVIRRVCVATW